MPSISLSGAPTSATQLDMDSIDPAALSLRPSQQQHIFHPHQHASTSPSPTPSMPPAAAASSSVASAAVDPSLPPKPDRAKHDAIKARYRVLQNKWQDLTADRTKLAADLEAAEQKRDKLQAEADMLIEQMHELAPHISLAPDYVDLSSDEGGDDTYNGYIHGAGSGSYLDNSNNGHRHLHHDPRRRMSTAGSDSNIPSSSINYFSGQLFGLNSGLDFGSDLSPVGSTSTLSGSMNSKKGSNGRTAARDGLIDGSTKGKQEKQVMLDPEQAREEEARIEEEQRAKERTKSYNPDNVKVRIGVMPSTFVHPLVQGSSNRSSKSRSPSTTSDNAALPTIQDSAHNAISSGETGERQAKRPRTMSKEKSPFKEQSTIKEEEEPNPP